MGNRLVCVAEGDGNKIRKKMTMAWVGERFRIHHRGRANSGVSGAAGREGLGN